MLICLSSVPVKSQEVLWQTGFDGFLDNREYEAIDLAYTVFGSRFRAEAGAELSGTHVMQAGFNYLYEFGSAPTARLPELILYYRYRKNGIDFRLGAFPRRHAIRFPVSLLSDTLRYYRPHMEGTYLAVCRDWGYQRFFIDWTSRKTNTEYERFIFGFSGRWRFGRFYLDHHAMMGHFAGRGLPDPGHRLRDNGGFDALIGSDLSDLMVLDSLDVGVGALVSLDRIREGQSRWQTPAGLVARVSGSLRGWGLSGMYYFGKGHEFLYGDPYYRLPRYGRLDLYYEPFKNREVHVRFNAAFHFAEGQVDYSQQIFVTMDLQGSRKMR